LVESFPNVDWDTAADEPLHPLTSRELDVLRYPPDPPVEHRHRRPTEDLQNTVKTHLKDIYRKLRVGSRNEAVVVAVRLGLLNLADERTSDRTPPPT
jgi:Response regulator containing a CheY-like receiver domain and an HTH DNA-binding domain